MSWRMLWPSLGAALLCLATVALLLAASQVRAGAREEGRHGAPTFRPATVVLTTTITTDTVWTSAGSPYMIEGTVFVYAPATLTVEKGVRLVLTGGGITGDGTLVLRGTPEERLVVEGIPFAPTSDPYAFRPGPPRRITVHRQDVQYADLRSITINGCEPFEYIVTCYPYPTVSFDHVNLEDTFFNYSAAYVRLTNSTITRGYLTSMVGEVVGNLIWLNRGLPQNIFYGNRGALNVSRGTVMYNTIVYNASGGLRTPIHTSEITVTANNIYGNSGWDLGPGKVNFPVSDPVQAPNNWWGTTDLAAIQSRITGTVDYLPIATAPIPQASQLYATYFPWLAGAGARGW